MLKAFVKESGIKDTVVVIEGRCDYENRKQLGNANETMMHDGVNEKNDFHIPILPHGLFKLEGMAGENSP